MITHELMRELLNSDLQSIREIAEFVPNEIVYNALIIREFMIEHDIDDSRQGIREFYAFKRVRMGSLVSHSAGQIARKAWARNADEFAAQAPSTTKSPETHANEQFNEQVRHEHLTEPIPADGRNHRLVGYQAERQYLQPLNHEGYK